MLFSKTSERQLRKYIIQSSKSILKTFDGTNQLGNVETPVQGLLGRSQDCKWTNVLGDHQQ
jgi:hypothetical protein